MRRKDREVTDFKEIIEIIRQCDSCTLGLNGDGYPYLVPMSFGLHVENGQVELYFHSATVGTKLDWMRKDPRASFSMECKKKFVINDANRTCTMQYGSVVGKGTIVFLSEEEKYSALKKIMRQYDAEDYDFNTDILKATTVYKLVVSELTAKKNGVLFE